RVVKIWEIGPSGAASAAQPVHIVAAPTLICDLAFSPDGRRLAGINRDLLKIWDVAADQEVLTLRGAPQRHWDPAFNPRIAFSPDGKRLVGTNWNESISMWDAGDASDEDALARHQI